MLDFLLRVTGWGAVLLCFFGTAAARAASVPGDLDGNGAADVVDLQILQQVVVNHPEEGFTPCLHPDWGDLDGSGALDAPDLAILSAVLAEQPGTERLPAAPPRDFLGLIQDGYRLTWVDEAAPGDCYLLERRKTSDAAFSPLARIPAPASQFVDSNYDPSQPDVYRLRLDRGGLVGPPAYCHSKVKAYTYIRILGYDALWSPVPTLQSLLSHLSGMAKHKDNPNLELVLLGDAYGPNNSIYGWVDSAGAHYSLVPELNMGKVKTYDDFFQWVHEEHPGQRYVVSFWGHGSGAVGFDVPDTGNLPSQPDSVGLDLNNNDELTSNEMHTVFTNLARLVGRKVEVAFFCACLVQMMENAYALRDGVEYVVAGESVVGCYGDVLETLANSMGDSSESLARQNTDNQLYPGGRKDVVYSTVKTAEIPRLAQLLDELAKSLMVYEQGGANRADQVRTAAASVQNMQFVMGEISNLNAYLDIADLCDKLSDLGDMAVTQAAVAVREHLLNQVIRQLFIQRNDLHLYENAHGLSIFHPTPAYPHYLAEYDTLLFAQETAWGIYLKTLFATVGEVAKRGEEH